MSGATIQLWLAALLALASLLAVPGLLRRRRELARWQWSALLLAQPALAGLLYLSLYPPLQALEPQVLTVLGAGWDEAIDPTPGGPRIALPEAGPDAPGERAPDLATALRRHPGASGLHLLGQGLEARDRPVAEGRIRGFDPAPAPLGLVELGAASRVPVGNDWPIHGRVAGLPGARLELHDPAGELAAAQETGPDGRFSLVARTRVAGLVEYELRVLDAQGRLHEQLPLALEVIEPKPARLLVLAGAAGAELKYLRRWASDAGLDAEVRIEAGRGLQLGGRGAVLDADTLDGFDTVLLDARRLASLDEGTFETLTGRLRAGLGLLLRIDTPPSELARARLRRWGFELRGEDSVLVQLAGEDGAAPPPVLHRRRLDPHATRMASALPDASGQPLLHWRALGRGRIGLTGLLDSHLLVLAGQPERHASLWSQALATVSRPAPGSASPAIELPAWPGARMSLCALAHGARVIAGDGRSVELAIDPATGARRCAAYWPDAAGWHRLESDGVATPFFVLPADTGLALRQQQRSDATRALLAGSADGSPADQARQQRGPAWPWLLAWLGLAGLVWWLEKRPRPAARETPDPKP